MKDWRSTYKDWEGTAAELAEVASSVADQLDLDPAVWAYNERLVRSYVQAGALTRPERRGKEAFFGFAQLVECLTVRALLNDGWPLAKIAEFTQLSDRDALLAVLPANPSGGTHNLLRRLQRDRVQRASASSRWPAPIPAAIAPPVMERSADLLRRRQTARGLSQSLAARRGSEDSRVCVRLEFAPGFHAFVEREQLQHMTREQADALGQAFSHALIDQRLHGKGERK